MNSSSNKIILSVVETLSSGKDAGYKNSLQALLLQVYELGRSDGMIETTEKQINEMSEHHQEIMKC
jgi:hypothetical protein